MVPNSIPDHPSQCCRGFTLVELMIVMLILGIIASIAVGKLKYSSLDANAATIMRNLDALYEAIDMNKTSSANPPEILPQWFTSGRIPWHPQSTRVLSKVQVEAAVNKYHPTSKVLDGALAAYWYNPTTGAICARVEVVGSGAQTLQFYNRVNNSNETNLGNYTSGESTGS